LGYATEAATALKHFAFNDLKLNQLISIVSPKNVRSVRVVSKLGMVPIGTVMFSGYSYPDIVYSTKDATKCPTPE
jgi:RimJ/RimL family protein N-acetyltransferase